VRRRDEADAVGQAAVAPMKIQDVDGGTLLGDVPVEAHDEAHA